MGRLRLRRGRDPKSDRLGLGVLLRSAALSPGALWVWSIRGVLGAVLELVAVADHLADSARGDKFVGLVVQIAIGSDESDGEFALEVVGAANLGSVWQDDDRHVGLHQIGAGFLEGCENQHVSSGKPIKAHREFLHLGTKTARGGGLGQQQDHGTPAKRLQGCVSVEKHSHREIRRWPDNFSKGGKAQSTAENRG